MMNKIVISGRLVRDSELRYSSNGKPVLNFTVACQRNFKNREGEYEADFIKVVIWGKLAELAAKHLDKGSLVNVSGRLQIRKSTNNGKTYINPEIIANEIDFLDWFTGDKKDNNNSNQNENVTEDDFEDDDLSEDIPF